jgi:hypothetical protein
MYGRRQPRGLSRTRRGAVLILVLALLAIAALVASRLALASSRIAAEALERERYAVERWTELSVRRVLLPQADRVLTVPEDPAGPKSDAQPRKTARFSAQIELNRHVWDVVVADEQAKADVNFLYRQHEPLQAAARIRELMGTSGLPLRTITRSTSAPGGAANPASVSPITTWDRVFQLDRAKGHVAPALEEATSMLTCWGRGRLNIRTASPAALQAVCRDALDHDSLERLVAAVATRPDAAAEELFRHAKLSEREIERLAQRLTDRTTRYSLWMLRSDRSSERACLVVASTEPASPPITVCLRW